MKTKSITKTKVQVSERLLNALKKFNELVVTDRKLLNSFGVSTDRILLFGAKVQKIEALLSDNRLKELSKEKRIALRYQRKDLEQKIAVVSQITSAYLESKNLVSFSNRLKISKSLSNDELANLGRVVLLFAHNHKNELRIYGISDEILYELSTAIINISVIKAEIEVLEMEIVLQKILAKQLAAEIIEEIRFFAKIGRAIWLKSDKSRWKDYRLSTLFYQNEDVDIG